MKKPSPIDDDSWLEDDGEDYMEGTTYHPYRSR